MGDTQRGGLEFKIIYHLNREKGGQYRLLRGEKVIFRKDKRALRRIDRRL